MKVLFIGSNRIGDAVLSTGLVDYLGRNNPSARITIVCGPDAVNIFEAAPQVERIIPMAKLRWSAHWLGLWIETVGHFWDLVVDLRASALGWCVPTRARRIMSVSAEPVHRLVSLAKVLQLDQPLPPCVWTTTRHHEVANNLIAEGGPVLAIGPTANWVGKQWRPERFAELIGQLTSPKGILPAARVAVFGAADERKFSAITIDSIPASRRIDLVGRVDLLTAASCIERCSLYIGNDSGLMHLAAATGTPTLGLFGPSRECHYAPWGEKTAFVRTALRYEELVDVPGYDHRRQETLMDSLTVESVEEAAIALWRRIEL